MIEKKIIYIPYTRVIQDAHYQEIETGALKEVLIIDEHGSERREMRPIVNRVFVEAVTEKAVEEKTVWAVKTGEEEHHFATEKEARDFL